jgi:hypothetical protein
MAVVPALYLRYALAKRDRRSLTALLVAVLTSATAQAQAQNGTPPQIKAAPLPPGIAIDGRLDEPAWILAEPADGFLQTDPSEGAPASGRTVARVLAGSSALVIGIHCEDPDPSRIVSYSVRRDASLGSEDHVRIVLGTSFDGRTGYVFAVNPSGARYDALVNPGGETENADWDGIWEATTSRHSGGWTVEIKIPIQTLTFGKGLDRWHFNVQRRIQRLLESSRWASPLRQYVVTQTSRAGVLTDLPAFDLGLGLSVRPAMTAGGGIPAPGGSIEGEQQPSLDLTKRLGANLAASGTFNTDFAETEVDTRRTNLTRFPLLFPEKRTFFLEGADLFSFGLGLNQDVIPYFSRRIGLVNGREVPILAGGRLTGRVARTNLGALLTATNDLEGVVSDEVAMAAGRVKQDILAESWIGAIVTTGDPLGRAGSWLAGADFTYATSRFRGDKNFLVGIWGLATGRDDLGTDASAHGLKVDYPNDKWDIAFTYKRIGRDFDPSLGFVPRRAVQIYNLTVDNRVRIGSGPLQQLLHEFQPSLVTNLHGTWESYRVFFAPVNWRFRSGDRFEFNANPTGERLFTPDHIAGVPVDAGTYQWMRYRLEVGTAQKRRLYTQVTWWFGSFYDGHLDQIIWTGAWNPTPLITVEFSGEHDVGQLSGGPIETTLVGTRVRVNFSPDLSLASYLQYDTDSDSVGLNTRLRWTILPVADLFVVYNHNVRSIVDRWELESNQLLVKLQYTWRR